MTAPTINLDIPHDPAEREARRAASTWRCAGCGASSPDRQRICGCPTNVVVETATGRQEWKRPHWSVTVSRDGEEIVTIESNCLSGREISAADEDAIRTAARHLLSFIGEG